jgi:bifunctional non-homologous end joining protein LigD
MSQPASINLFYTEGSSDKVYQVQLVEVEGGWKVNAQNGARGGTLKPQVKTPNPVPFEEAKKIYDQLVKSKVKKGYTEDVSGSVYQDTSAGEDFTGVVPQLLNALDDEVEIHSLLADDDWIAQEKHDGERRMVRKTAGKVQGINRTGMVVPLPVSVADHFGNLSHDDFLIDGEIMGDRYVVFDVLEEAGKDLRKKSYTGRTANLPALVGQHPDITPVVTAAGSSAKRALADQVRARLGEGVVFKLASAAFAPGRPASGGSQRKWKFTESATLVAGPATSGKRSVSGMALDANGNLVHVGKVTVPANHAMPKEGDLFEAGYLYRMPGEGGCLFQPVYKGARPDKTEADRLDSLKLKAAVVAPQKRKAAGP